MEEVVQEKVSQKENELNATYDEKMRNYEERYGSDLLTRQLRLTTCKIRSEQDLQRQVSLLRNQLRDLRVSNDTNQAKLLDHSSRQGTWPSVQTNV